MQSDVEVRDDQKYSPAWIFEFIKEHYGWISALIAALAPLAGVASLLVYANYIGRPDAFMRSLEFGPGLVVLWLASVLLFGLIVASMLITSLFFSFTLTWLRPEAHSIDSIIKWLMGLVSTGMSCLVLVLASAAIFDFDPSAWWALTVFLPPAVLSWWFIKRCSGKAEALSAGDGWLGKLKVSAGLTLTLGITALAGIYPAWFVTFFYSAKPETAAWPTALLLCFLAMIASLMPAIGYYRFVEKGRIAQVRGALTGVLIFLGVLMLAAPTLISVPSVGAMKLLGISDRQVRHYLVDSAEYPSSSLNAARWSITDSQAKKYTVKAWSLYSYGAVDLLCPQSLAKTKNQELDQHTQQCVAFKRSAVSSVDVVDDSPALTEKRPEA